MYVVMTKVKLLPGTSKQSAELFEKTNPDLVSEERDWLGARMIFDSQNNVVTVLATWRDANSYEAVTAKPGFQKTMQEFAKFFAATPEISVRDLLVEMAPRSN